MLLEAGLCCLATVPSLGGNNIAAKFCGGPLALWWGGLGTTPVVGWPGTIPGGGGGLYDTLLCLQTRHS